jgi:GntR family transcriptional regulator, transcriptional repressor for pyruvate dehydrogenase complex
MAVAGPELFRPVQRARVTPEIVRRLRELIAQRRLRPGDRLPAERTLAELLGVGLPTMREALRVMGAMGLLVVRPREGSFLGGPAAVPPMIGRARTSIGGADLLSLFELRMAVEPGQVALAARRATREALAQMWTVLAAQRASVEQGATGAAEGTAFHCLIAEATGKTRLVGLMRSATPTFQETRDAVLRDDGRPARSLREHLAIFAAIEERNPDLAMRRILAHIRRVERVLFAAHAAGHVSDQGGHPPRSPPWVMEQRETSR